MMPKLIFITTTTEEICKLSVQKYPCITDSQILKYKHTNTL